MVVWRLWILCGVALLLLQDSSGLSIGGCEHGIVDVVEDSNPSFTCEADWNRTVQWTVYNDTMKTIFSGSCAGWSCTPWNEKFNLFAKYYNGHTLTIKGITRNSAYTLSCNDSTTYAQCDLRITVKLVYRACSVSISHWIVTGSCTVRGLYSSDKHYTCKWREIETNEEFGGFQSSLTNYTEDSRTYDERVCFFAKPMPLSTGYHTYSVSVSPNDDESFKKEIYIDAPYSVKLNHSCPEYVFEGSHVSCECYASRSSSPPALLVWEGMNHATLLLKNVSRRLNHEQFTCRLEWGPDNFIQENTSYKLTVAYGPSYALITGYEKTTEDESEMISFTCTATDVYPSAVFKWNVTCYNQTDYGDSSHCSLNFTHKFESLAILCTASNTYFAKAYASDVYVIPQLGIMQANTARANAGLIGGVIAAVLVVLVIVAVLIVYIIKRRKGMLDRERGFLGIFSGARKFVHQGPAMSTPYAVVNKPQTQTPIQRQAAPSGDLYTITKTTSSGHVVDDYAAVCKRAHNNAGGTEINGAHQATQKTNGIREPTVVLTPETKPTAINTNVQYFHGTGYMNVTEVSTDSGLGVYHVVSSATMSGSTEPDTNEYSAPTTYDDEYNELHFEEDRTGQEDQAGNYHHLQLS